VRQQVSLFRKNLSFEEKGLPVNDPVNEGIDGPSDRFVANTSYFRTILPVNDPVKKAIDGLADRHFMTEISVSFHIASPVNDLVKKAIDRLVDGLLRGGNGTTGRSGGL
jgi:hypothetical protein